MEKKPVVVKIGGSTLGSHDTTMEDLVTLQRKGVPLVVVHGGGKLASEWLVKEGVSSEFIRGKRVTDAHTLRVVVGVFAGVVNKELVAAISALGGLAIGLSGVDGNLLEAETREPELGYVGEVVKVNVELLKSIIDGGYIPVIAPIGIKSSDGTKARGTLLNINADDIAGEIAATLEAERLIFGPTPDGR